MHNSGFLGYFLKPDWAEMWEKGIKDAWADDMVKKHGSIEASWNNYANAYEEEEMKYSNRADLVKRLLKSKPGTLLDVGGGTGVFAIPMAKQMKRVVVLDPSDGMLEVLKGKAESTGINNIAYIRNTWEAVTREELLEKNEGKPYDVVLTSHSVYYIGDLHRSFEKMADMAVRYVYLLIGCNGYDRDKDYEKIYVMLHGKPFPPYPDYSFLYMVLRELGIEPNIEMIDTRGKKPVESLDEMIKDWTRHLEQPELTKEQEEALKAYLSKKMVKEKGQLFYPYESKNALIYWKTGDRRGCS